MKCYIKSATNQQKYLTSNHYSFTVVIADPSLGNAIPNIIMIEEVRFMNGVRIPQGDDTVKVELTVKELMALSGIKFHGNHNVEVSAKKKLQEAIEDQYHIEEQRPIN